VSPELVGALGLVLLIVFLFSGMWIGITMGVIGFVGYVYLSGIDSAFAVLGTTPYSTIAFYPLAALPLFILMGAVVSTTGVAGDLYSTAYKWVGQLRGGLAMATCVACGGFAAICGSSMASLITMGKVALPEMKRYNYDPRLATGCVAAGSTVGILIPPSIAFIIYGILTEQSVGHLFMAGIIPGILEVLFYIAIIMILSRVNLRMGPPGPKTSFREKIVSLKNTWAMIVLFLLVIGGIYGGIFTPTEAGAVGAFGAMIITLISRRLTFKNLGASILDTAQSAAMLMLLIVGAFIFMRFLAISKLPFLLAGTAAQLPLHPLGILVCIIIFYIIIGMFMDVMAAILLTVPIIYPLTVALGFDPIWFGVIVVRIIEIGLITPPVGMNVFILSGATEIPVGTIYRGVLPFVMADFLHVALLVAFPVISLFLPSMM
jgi:C4-dicarboxylate transporter DctM subunit